MMGTAFPGYNGDQGKESSRGGGEKDEGGRIGSWVERESRVGADDGERMIW